MLVRYIARLLMVLSTFVLGWGGGGSVAIERYIQLLWATVLGMCMFYLWFMVGELRLPGDRVVRAAMTAPLAGPRVSRQSLR